jgi:hypothetical protein
VVQPANMPGMRRVRCTAITQLTARSAFPSGDDQPGPISVVSWKCKRDSNEKHGVVTREAVQPSFAGRASF